MHTHTTYAAKVFEMRKPRGYPATALEITDRVMKDEIELGKTIPESASVEEKLEAKSRGMRYLRAVFAAIESPEHWKAPLRVAAPEIDREWVKAAIIWYHGTKPVEVGNDIYSGGYAC